MPYMSGRAAMNLGHWDQEDRSARSRLRIPRFGSVLLGLGVVALWAATTAAAAPAVNGPEASSTGSLNAINCTATTTCAAVGTTGVSGSTSTLAEAWNGTSWTVQSTPRASGDDTLAGVACGTTSECLAVGDSSDEGNLSPLAELWSGGTWSVVSVPLPVGARGGALESVSCSSVDACVAVGFYANSANTNVVLAEFWNGTAFTVESVPLPTGATTSVLEAVGCSPSPSVDCEAVGWNFVSGFEIANSFAAGWNGSAWSLQTTPLPLDASDGSYPTGVSCGSSSACMAVGEGFDSSDDLAPAWSQKWNGHKWANQKMPVPAGTSGSIPAAVSCTSATDAACMAVGSYSNGEAFVILTEVWDGTAWRVQKAPEPTGSTSADLSGVSCISAALCEAVGNVTTSSSVIVTVAEGWNGSKWVGQKTPTP
jgi:hypothetical protein